MDRIFAPFNFQKRVAIFGEFLRKLYRWAPFSQLKSLNKKFGYF